MADTEFGVKLNDGVSGPAKTAADALDNLGKKFSNVAKNGRDAQGRFLPGGGAFEKNLSFLDRLKTIGKGELGKIDGSGLGSKVMGAGIASLTDKSSSIKAITDKLSEAGLGFEQLGGAASAAGSAIAGGFTAAISIGVTAVAALAAGIAALGAGLVAASVKFTQFFMEAGKFRETSLMTMEVMLKDATKAKQVYAQAVEFASKTPFETKEVVSMFQRLLTSGFKENELTRVATAVGDAAAATGQGQQAIDSIVRAMSQVRSKGRLQQEEMNQLTESGAVGQMEVFAEIAKSMNVKPEEVAKLVEAGKVKSDVAIEAMLKAIESTRGGMMAKQEKTLAGQLSTLRSRPFELFNASFEGKGSQAFYGTVKQIVTTLQQAFDPKSATGQKIVSFIDQFAAGLNVIAKLVLSFAQGFAKGFDSTKPKDAAETMTALASIDLAKVAEDVGKLGANIGTLSGNLTNLKTQVFEAVDYLAQYETTWTVVKYALIAVGAILAVVGLAILLVIANLAAFVTFMLAIPVAIVAAAIYLAKLANDMIAAGAAMAIGGFQIGVQFVQGLIDGIASMVGVAVAMATTLATSVAAGVTGPLMIKSPSRLMEQYGSYTAEGLTNGMEGGKADVASSAASMASSVASGAAGGLSGASGGSGGIRVESLVINANGGGAEDIKTAVLEAFEQLAIEMGLNPRTV